MNNTFNINRFGKLLALDGRKYLRNFGITLAILSGLTLVLWLLTIIFGFTMPTLARWSLIYVAVLLAIMLVPAKAFGDINLPREGVRFAMLPASNLEKYLSYVLFCLMTPVIVIFGSWGVDSLLTLLPFGGFTHYIKGFGIVSILQNFVSEMGEIQVDDMMDYESYQAFKKFMNDFGPQYLYSIINGILFNAGLFMFGNLLFKTHKTGKTLACMIGISYVFTMIMQFFFITRGIFPWMNKDSMGISADLNTVTEFATSTMLISNIFHTVLAIGLYIGIYFKLKTQKY